MAVRAGVTIRCPCRNRVFIIYEATDAATYGQQGVTVVPEGEKTAADD